MRINQIVNLIKPGSIVIDVGSDHAKLAIKLLTNKIATFVYNIEVNQAPLDNTIKNLDKFHLLDKTQNILNDGLKNFQIKDKINYCVIAGMGAKNIANIIENKPNNLNIENFILVPNNNAWFLRRYLKENKYKVVYEEIIKESNHFYELIQVSLKNGKKIITLEDEYFGPYNLLKKTKIPVEYIKFKLDKFNGNSNLIKNNKIEYELIKNYINKM